MLTALLILSRVIPEVSAALKSWTLSTGDILDAELQEQVRMSVDAHPSLSIRRAEVSPGDDEEA